MPPGIGSTATASQKPCGFEALEIKELSQQPNLDPLLNLLTLPAALIWKGANHGDCRYSPRKIRHTRAVQDWLAEGRQEGRRDEASSVALRQLNRRCGPLTGATTAQIQALPLEQLEALAVGAAFSAGVALLDFQGPDDLSPWLAANGLPFNPHRGW